MRQRLTESPNKQSNGAVVALAFGVAALVVTERRRRLSAPRPNPPPRSSTTLAPSLGQLPVIDTARCLGCHACVDACPFDALAVERYVAVLQRPDACCGAGPCEQSCPNGSLRLLPTSSPPRGPRLTPELEAPERPSLFLAGDVTGGALIRNAVRQGAAVARTLAERLAREAKGGTARVPVPLDLLVVGAGPAGLSAGLVAGSLGLRVVVVDQAGVAASIRRFSRQKLVLDAPPATEEKLPLWLGDATKEELVGRWEHTLRRARLDVREGVQVLGARVAGDGSLVVHARGGAGELVEFSSRYVLLAIGTRGTPRPLAVRVPDAAAARVHYELSDARVFTGQRCIIVGLGDVAMESALALAAQPDCEVTIVHRGSGFARGSRRNIDAVARLVASGRIRLLFAARVVTVRAASLEIEVAGASRGLGYDALFVHVGQLPSESLLASFGVCVPP